MEDRVMIAKAAIPVGYGVLGSVFAATTENTTIAVGTTLAVVAGFAGLLIQQVVRNQRAVWAIVTGKDEQIESLRDDLHVTRWELACALFRLNERPDPGPFTPRLRRSP